MNSLNLIEQRIGSVMQQVMKSADLPLDTCAEEIAAQCNISGLTAEMILTGKEPGAIASQWLHSQMMKKMKPKGAPFQTKGMPLLPFSQVVFQSMKETGDEDIWTFPFSLRLPQSEVDEQRLTEAIETALANHPVFSTRIDEEGLQHLEEGYRTPYFQYKVHSNEEAVQLDIKANRILGDAASFGILLQDICLAYQGESLLSDTYCSYIEEVERKKTSAAYQEHREYMDIEFGNITCPTSPAPDTPFSTQTDSWLAVHYEDMTDIEDPLSRLCTSAKVSTNTVFSLATTLALMDYNHTDDAALTWAYLGRENEQQQHIFGSLHRDVPFKMSRSSQSTPATLLAEAKRQIEQGIIHSEYPFTLLAKDRTRWQNAVNVLLQADTTKALADCPLPIEPVPDPSPQKAYCTLDVEIYEHPLMIALKYSSAHYKKESIHRFAALIRKNVELLLHNKNVKF